MKWKEKYRLMKKITIIVFLLMIYGLFGLTLLTKDKGFSETENRILQEKPDITVEKYFNGEYAKEYEEYVKDQFPGRDAFVKLKNQTEMLMGKRRLNGVLI